MANIRQDQAQLIITIDAKESAEYQKTLQNTAKGVQDIKKLTAGTDEYNKVLNEQAAISRKLASSDFSKLSGKQLSDRRSQLVQLQRTLPQVTFAEAGFERELQRVNQALATNAQRTRAVSAEMGRGSIGVKGFLAAYVGIGALKAFGVELFEQIKKINSLNAAYKLLIPETDKRARADAFLTRLATDYGLELTKLRDEYIKYNASAKASNLTLKDQELVFESVSKAGAVLGLSTETQGRAFTALQQIMSKGKVSAEELKGQLGDALPGAVTIMAKALGVGTGELQKMLEKGEVMADDALPKFARELQKAYGVDQVKTIDNLASAQNRAANSYTALVTVIGDKVGPVLTQVFNIIAKTIDGIVKGDKATGQFAGAINFMVGALRIAGNVLSFVGGEIVRWYDGLVNLFNVLKGLPIIGGIIKNIGASFSFIVDAVTNTTAVIAGFKAAFQQAFSNAADYVKSTIATLKIFAAEAELALTLDDVEEERIRKRIKLLENQKAYYEKAGRTVGQAFIDGRNEALQKEAIASKKVQTVDDDPVTGGGGGGGGGESDEAKKKREKAEKEAAALLKKKLELQAKERDALLAFNPLNPEFAQGVLDLRLKMLEDAAAREQLALEESYLQGKISLEQYELEKLRITSGNLATRIELLDAYGQAESDKRRELNVELLKVESDIVKERAAQIGELENAQLTEIENKFANRLITEEEYNLSRLRVQLNFYDEQLRMLEENGLIETEVYKKILDERLKTQIDYNKQKTDNEQRTADLKRAIAEQGLDAAKEIFSLGSDLLSQDEKARKKHASAIKAFESSAILVNAISEISAIHKKYAAIPGGTFVAVAQSIATAVRAGIAIAKVNAQQFYLGGKIKGISGQLIDEQPNINTLPGGDNVLIAAKKGEVVLNQQQQDALGGPEVFRRLRVPGFNNGGLIPSLPRTTPTISPQVLSRNGVSGADARIDSIMRAVEMVTQAVAAVPEAISSMDLKTHVVYTDFNKVQNTVDEIKRISSF